MKLSLILSVLLALSILWGCPAKIQPVVEIAPGQFEVPIKETGTLTPAPGHEEVLTEIVVPPSTTPTTIQIYKRPRTLMQKVFPSRSSPTVEAVTNNQAVEVKQEKHTPWWTKVLIALGGLGAISILGKMYLGPVWALASKIFKRI